MKHAYYLVWGGDCDGIYSAVDHRQVVSAWAYERRHGRNSWDRLIGAAADTIDRIGREWDR